MNIIKDESIENIIDFTLNKANSSIKNSLESCHNNTLINSPPVEKHLFMGLALELETEHVIIDSQLLNPEYYLLTSNDYIEKKYYVNNKDVLSFENIDNIKLLEMETITEEYISIFIDLIINSPERLARYKNMQFKEADFYITGLLIPELYVYLEKFIADNSLNHILYFNHKGTIKLKIEFNLFPRFVDGLLEAMRHRNNLRKRCFSNTDLNKLIDDLILNAKKILNVNISFDDVMDFKSHVPEQLNFLSSTLYYKRFRDSQNDKFFYFYEFLVHSNSHILSLRHLSNDNLWLKYIKSNRVNKIKGIIPKPLKPYFAYNLFYKYRDILIKTGRKI